MTQADMQSAFIRGRRSAKARSFEKPRPPRALRPSRAARENSKDPKKWSENDRADLLFLLLRALPSQAPKQHVNDKSFMGRRQDRGHGVAGIDHERERSAEYVATRWRRRIHVAQIGRRRNFSSCQFIENQTQYEKATIGAAYIVLAPRFIN